MKEKKKVSGTFRRSYMGKRGLSSTFSQRRKRTLPLRCLLHRLGDLLKFYRERFSKDVAYWYGERTLTGLLSVAAWSNGGWGLEEFTSERRQAGKRIPKGRGDLWIESDNRDRYTIEAKIIWPEGLASKSSINRIVANIEKCFGRSLKQLSKLENQYREGCPAAICYVVPCIPQDTYTLEASQVSHAFRSLVSHLDDSHTVVGAFWYRDSPPSWEEKHYKDRKYNKPYTYPGVLVACRYWPDWPCHK